MQEWQKILISALAGFFAAVLAEPFKAWVSGAMKGRRVRRALYESLAAVQGLLRLVASWAEKGSEVMLGGETKAERGAKDLDHIHLDVFEYYFLNDKPIFYSLREAFPFLNIFGAIQLVRDEKESDFQTRATHARNVIAHLDSEVDAGNISGLYLSWCKYHQGRRFYRAWVRGYLSKERSFKLRRKYREL